MEMESHREREGGYVEECRAGANALIAVEGVMADWRISKKTKGHGHEYLCDTGMPVRNGNFGTDRITTPKAASVRKQLGSQNSKSKEGRPEKNGGGKGRDGVQRIVAERLVRSILQWAGHVERMADVRLPKRVAELCDEGRRKRGRPRLILEDCVNREVRKTGEGEYRKKKNSLVQSPVHDGFGHASCRCGMSSRQV